MLNVRRKSKWDLRDIWEGICYVTRTGCQWRLLPIGYPPWQTVYWYFRRWTMDGTIEIAHQEIRKAIRREEGKKESASIGIIDSCSVRMNATSGMQHGIDGNKKIKELKRHVIADSPGNRCCCTHAANIHDSKGAKQVLGKFNNSKCDEPNLEQIFADAGYRGKLIKWVKEQLKMNRTIVKRRDKTIQWAVQPKRWIMERTFAWLLNFRRLVINYERTPEFAISYICLAMMCLMVKNIN
ncbi:IS5 family transposase [Hydrotalea sp.]|uniref:IS5 family transposase n=2 Tax=Hydrotalea sp. TaxID=2881279 RepID=UPI002626A7B1|nr:IS5 family transposase [Hydrotalea sp.]